MKRRSFINKVGVGSVAVAAATAGVNSLANAAGPVPEGQNGGQQSGAGAGRSSRLPDDLENLVGDKTLLHKPDNLTVACYTFPNYHPSAIHNRLYGPGWTEYNLMRSARPWFEGHQQPRGPLLGELDESLPSTWEKYNTLAKQSGIDVFIWDWYWYRGEPALHEALENGFLRASNTNDMKFACMWTNHSWYILYPTTQTDRKPVYPPGYAGPHTSLQECWRSLSYIISRYFHLPNYWRIDGKPVLAIWDIQGLVNGIGKSSAKQLLKDLEGYALKLGHKGIHFHATGVWSADGDDIGIHTRGAYNLAYYAAHLFQPTDSEICDYEIATADAAFKMWPEGYKNSKAKYLPTVSPGWDSTPRYVKPPEWNKKPRETRRYMVLKNESPAAFKAFVQAAFAYLNGHPDLPPILTIGVWNEWTEGQYLLPDNRLGYGMLDALAEAMGVQEPRLLHGKL